MNKKLTIAILTFIVAQISFAQDGEDWRLYRSDKKAKKDTVRHTQAFERSVSKRGKIKIIQSSDIALLDSMKKEYPTLPSGYRVQIYFGKREEARDKKAEFLKEYPEMGAYISYLAPNFRLRVGDFRNRLECDGFKKEIEPMFPGSYIVQDKIELPPLRKSDSE
ncbi:MAG: SPOR domain-containing protein [Cryomorphaceae bacterium]|nr:SPOR domain-containing protein [Flavobacteriales bacterium]